MAILKTGEHPIWFILTDSGPVHIESIEDAVSIMAFVPWPYAPHIRFLHKIEDSLVMAVNRYGFLKVKPDDKIEDVNQSLVLYRFPAADVFRENTVGGFINYDNKPTAVLYTDTRFLDTVTSPVLQRTWSFNMDSNTPFSVQIPVLQLFPENEGWNIDTLRYGNDGFYYFRAVKTSGLSPSVRMFRKSDLSNTASFGDEISHQAFFSSIIRYENIPHEILPPLPDGFIYALVEQVNGNIFAVWEEFQDYSIGAAGFMVIRINGNP